MAEVPRAYWDADVVLNFLNGYDADDAATAEALLRQANDGEIEIVTSALSIVEVAFVRSEYDAKELPADVDDRIADLWYPRGPIKIVELNMPIAEDARSLVRMAAAKGAGRLGPRDATHLASARHVRAGVVHTRDKKLYRLSEDVGIEISPPKGGRAQLQFPPTT